MLIAWGTKGFDPDGCMLLSEVASEVFPSAGLAVVSGPSFAGEVAHGLPTALTVASPDADVADTVATWLRGERVRVYTNRDLAGVQLGGGHRALAGRNRDCRIPDVYALRRRQRCMRYGRM